MAWYRVITSHCLSQTCTVIKTISCSFSSPHMGWSGPQMVWQHLRDTLWCQHTLEVNASLAPACCISTCNTHPGHMRCTTSPLQRGRWYTSRSLVVVKMWRTCDFRCVRLGPRVSWVWSSIDNIWIYSKEGGGISSYMCYTLIGQLTHQVQNTITSFLVFIDLLNIFSSAEGKHFQDCWLIIVRPPLRVLLLCTCFSRFSLQLLA